MKKRTLSSHTPMADISEDILTEILSRLPVAPLLKLRCVCKSWKGLIDSPLFIYHHLNYSRWISNSNLNIILRMDSLYSEDFDVLTDLDQATFQELSHPLRTPNSETEVLGSCNGLLALSNGEDDIIFWNPSIRRFHNIAVGDIEFSEHCPLYVVYGFGYDYMSDDYKLVRIVQYYAEGTVCTVDLSSHVMVYSLNCNSWHQLPNFPYFLRVTRGNGVFVNGALHWVVGTTRVMDSEYDDVDYLVAAFDLETEDYWLVPLPEFVPADVRITVGVLGECLSVMSRYPNKIEDVYIWVMKEYGVQDSWSILCSCRMSDLFMLTNSELTLNTLRYCEVLMPIGYSNCGRKVLLRWHNCYFVWYDLDKKSFDLPAFRINPDDREYIGLHTCLKSLVLLNNSISDCDFDIIAENEQEKKRKLNIRARFLNSRYKFSGKVI